MRNKFPKRNDGEPAGEDVCAGHALGFPLRAELGFLPIENITLDVFRCLCDVYTSGSAQPWEIAIKIAEENLGAAEGPLLVARVTALLRALRAERKLGFSYLSIGCQHVSPDELAVAGVLKAARTRDESAMERGLTLALDNPQTTARTQFAARALAALQSQHIAAAVEERADEHELQTQTLQAVYFSLVWTSVAMSVPSILPLNDRMPPKKPVAGSVPRQAGQRPVLSITTPDAGTGTEHSVRYRVDELLKGGREAVLVHRGQEYRLRITATGKLILTK